MKLITHSAIALIFLIGLATSLQAQAPDVAVRIRPPAGNCFPVQLKNLKGAPLNINFAVVSIFDRNCQRICISRIAVNRRLLPCRTLDVRICCQAQLPPAYIAYVQVFHTSGRNEQWFFQP